MRTGWIIEEQSVPGKIGLAITKSILPLHLSTPNADQPLRFIWIIVKDIIEIAVPILRLKVTLSLPKFLF